jgi:hypothetical protein
LAAGRGSVIDPMDQASRLASALPSTRQHAPFRSDPRRLRAIVAMVSMIVSSLLSRKLDAISVGQSNFCKSWGTPRGRKTNLGRVRL